MSKSAYEKETAPLRKPVMDIAAFDPADLIAWAIRIEAMIAIVHNPESQIRERFDLKDLKGSSGDAFPIGAHTWTPRSHARLHRIVHGPITFGIDEPYVEWRLKNAPGLYDIAIERPAQRIDGNLDAMTVLPDDPAEDLLYLSRLLRDHAAYILAGKPDKEDRFKDASEKCRNLYAARLSPLLHPIDDLGPLQMAIVHATPFTPRIVSIRFPTQRNSPNRASLHNRYEAIMPNVAGSKLQFLALSEERRNSRRRLRFEAKPTGLVTLALPEDPVQRLRSLHDTKWPRGMRIARRLHTHDLDHDLVIPKRTGR